MSVPKELESLIRLGIEKYLYHVYRDRSLEYHLIGKPLVYAIEVTTYIDLKPILVVFPKEDNYLFLIDSITLKLYSSPKRDPDWKVLSYIQNNISEEVKEGLMSVIESYPCKSPQVMVYNLLEGVTSYLNDKTSFISSGHYSELRSFYQGHRFKVFNLNKDVLTEIYESNEYT